MTTTLRTSAGALLLVACNAGSGNEAATTRQADDEDRDESVAPSDAGELPSLGSGAEVSVALPSESEAGGTGSPLDASLPSCSVECDDVPTPSSSLRACCPEPDQCGLELRSYWLLEGLECVARNQPGELHASCPESAEYVLPGLGLVKFPGCCRPDGACGYLMDRLVVVDVGLGCVDAEPFLSSAGNAVTVCSPDAGP